jgi:hypothetical protein
MHGQIPWGARRGADTRWPPRNMPRFCRVFSVQATVAHTRSGSSTISHKKATIPRWPAGSPYLWNAQIDSRNKSPLMPYRP